MASFSRALVEGLSAQQSDAEFNDLLDSIIQSIYEASIGEDRWQRSSQRQMNNNKKGIINMQLGMIGLGRMGANMVRRLIKGGHQCVVYDRSSEAVQQLVKEKAAGAGSAAEFVKKLTKPRAVWLMVPAAVVDQTIAEIAAVA